MSALAAIRRVMTGKVPAQTDLLRIVEMSWLTKRSRYCEMMMLQGPQMDAAES
jgi:hypothetical protein